MTGGRESGRVLLHVGDLFIQKSQGGFQRLAMLRVGGGLQFVHDAGTREFQSFFSCS